MAYLKNSEIHNHDLQKDESIEVSYSILIVGQEQKPDDILQKIAALVNVQLGSEDNGTCLLLRLQTLMVQDIMTNCSFIVQAVVVNREPYLSLFRLIHLQFYWPAQ